MFSARKLLLTLAAALGVIFFVGLNVWVYRYATRGKAISPKALWQTTTTNDASNPNTPSVIPASRSVIPANAGIQRTITQSPSPTPLPRPTGPGAFACDPYGVCNKYSEEARKQFCDVTYADNRCLDQCADKTKQCKQ